MSSPHGASEPSQGYVPARHRKNPLHPGNFWTLLRKTVSKWNDDPTLRFGAGLAYYTAFAVVPLLFIVVEVAAFLFGREGAEGLLFEHVEQLIGDQGAQAVRQLLDTWERVGIGGMTIFLEAIIMFLPLPGPLISFRIP